MRQFWWVNHAQTARQEIEGQYLWSPKTQSNGARSEFYNNMRRASPGDLILSYAEQAVRYVGRVTEFAFTAPKPPEFGTIGAYWSHEGWLLPVFWVPLSPSVRPKSILQFLQPHLPEKYSPINPATGGGNQAAYLTNISEPLFNSVTSSSTFARDTLANGGANSLNFEIVTEILDDAVERRIRDDAQLDATTRESVILARRGQGKFRNNVAAIESSCRLTGITNPSLLIASHIKPWRICQSADERLDGMNGLLLTPDADLLFDRGFIGFQDEGEVIVSSRVDKSDLRRLGFDQLVIDRFGLEEAPAHWRTDSFLPRQQDYLAYHRSAVFLS